MKNLAYFLFVILFLINFKSLNATDFLDVQLDSVYNNTENTVLNNNKLSVAQASEDSLTYREYDSSMRIVKKTVWKSDFVAIKEIITWEYEDEEVLPDKKIITNLEDEINTEIKYVYDEKNRILTMVETVRNLESENISTDDIITKVDYSYTSQKNASNEDVLLVDETVYINDILSKKIVWLTINQREVTKYYINKISISTIYDNDLRKSEIIKKDGIKIGERTWE